MARKLKTTPPPRGMVWIEDTEEEPGVSPRIPGIASRLGITASTYRKWRMAGKGPATFLLGKRVAARISALDTWLIEQEQAGQRPRPETRPPELRTMHVRAKSAA